MASDAFYSYLPYPPNWPKYTPKDKLADWFVAYADAMELNWWGNTTLKGDAEYDEKTQKWRVTVDRKGHPPREMNVSHLVIATGFSGHPRMPNFKGKDSFKGPMMHASRFQSAEGWQGKKAVVVGACNTGHDIAEGELASPLRVSFYKDWARGLQSSCKMLTIYPAHCRFLRAWRRRYFSAEIAHLRC